MFINRCWMLKRRRQRENGGGGRSKEALGRIKEEEAEMENGEE